MSFKSILAAYSGDASGSSGLKLALHMAHKYDAHLTGVVWHGPTPIQSRLGRYMTQDILDMLAGRDAEVVTEIKSAFQARIRAEGLEPRASFIDLKGVTDFSLAETARGYDITVMGSRAAELGREHFRARPDVVALRSGRPVILVPQDFEPTRLGDRALVAWDGKRSAARALSDAMQILETKQHVTVLSVGTAPPRGPGDDAATLLERHGLSVDRQVRPAGPRGIARTILDACDEEGVGLLIMGAYEHSKFTEDLLGGVTQDILDLATVPVLLSH